MKPVIILFGLLLHFSTEYTFDLSVIRICSDTDDQEEFSIMFGEDELGYVDFQRKDLVCTLPAPFEPQIDLEKYFEPIYELAYRQMINFKSDMNYMKKTFNYPSPAQEAPISAVYSKNDVQLGSDNTLICLVTGFYPPRVTVRWTKNIKNVTSGVSLSRYYLNENGYFRMFSSMQFTPQEDDMYTCTVEHEALDEPLTRYWDVEVSEPSLGPSVFCGVGLTLGLLGVATGTFFLVKGNQCNTRPETINLGG
ncbi:H-2 class II histocompatibility antigen, A-Q alpha chain-like [Alosa pseudoharengus]|uniref:H-2 class II histocompatibility antigen, A-Q alpha chain-like n=1 Tax=Alosa pseudoharengus TaxID=34774 RepID=UPI003F89AD84